ncbi:cytochrome P450 [Streptomyces lateritius]|uniref:cytochrome P450 n=1 Tax=Streptomyces lateritius TaxID=67313 RepID=UPI001C8B2545|nr:cytochrome P450 [Streptomyces lateritius]MBX9422358.1 cytochrome P450 [Streptomyces lateritius]
MIRATEETARPPVPDLSDPLLHQSGQAGPALARLRREDPVCRVRRADGSTFWAVLTYDLITRVLADPATFSSTGGMRLDADPVATAAATGKMMVITDPPRHGMIRRVVSSAFTPRMVLRLEETMRRISVEVIEAALEQDSVDFTEVAARLPLSVICDMLGVPRADWDFMLSRTMTAFGVGGDHGPEEQQRVATAHTDIFLYYDELMRLRRKEPQEDIISALVHGRIDGRPLTEEEIILNCNGLISGGNETTRHATIGGLLALIEHPGQWRRLREEPEVLPTAVQEILRFTTPAMHVLRTATRDTELARRRIAAGDMVALWLASGNRDESVFEDPDRFDIGRREVHRNLTFAYGSHFCIGSALATTELNIFFDVLRQRVARPEPTGEVRRMRSNLIGGIEHLPVRLVPQGR